MSSPFDDNWDDPFKCCEAIATDVDIDDVFPFELTREFRLPGTGLFAGCHSVNCGCLSLVHGAMGFDVICCDSFHAQEMTGEHRCQCPCENADDTFDHGGWNAFYPGNMDSQRCGLVSGHPKCRCSSDTNDHDVPWSDAFEVKCESRHLAGCAVAWFFVRTLNYFPIDMVDTGGEECPFVLMHHKISKESEVQN